MDFFEYANLKSYNGTPSTAGSSIIHDGSISNRERRLQIPDSTNISNSGYLR